MRVIGSCDYEVATYYNDGRLISQPELVYNGKNHYDAILPKDLSNYAPVLPEGEDPLQFIELRLQMLKEREEYIAALLYKPAGNPDDELAKALAASLEDQCNFFSSEAPVQDQVALPVDTTDPKGQHTEEN